MRLASLALFFVAGCVSSHTNPDCTGPVGLGGRPLPVCDGPMDVPVCDLPGSTTHTATWVRNELGAWVLEDGSLAFCDEADVVVCGDRSVVPYCLFKPES